MNPASDINTNSPFQRNDVASTSNQNNTPVCEDVERSTSPVLSNTKKSLMRMVKYRSRKKLLGKFSSQDSLMSSFTDSDSLDPLSPVFIDTQVSGDFDNNPKIVNRNVDVKARFKRLKKLQQQKKFRYDIVAKTSVNKTAIKKPDDLEISVNVDDENDNCDKGLICVGFNTVSGKNVYISKKKIKKYTELLNDITIEENDPMLQENPTNRPNSSVRNSKKPNVCQTQISDTQMIQAAENAESILELVDNQWTPDQSSSNKENSQNFNISSINFDTQWDVSPTNPQQTSNSELTSNSQQTSNSQLTSNSQQTSNSELTSNSQQTSNSEETPENINTQWFLSKKNKNPTNSETSEITEEDDGDSLVDSPRKKLENYEMKSFFGVLSFSKDGSTSLRQCVQEESNMQLQAKSNSWIFEVSSENEETLGFYAKYWKAYSKRFSSCVETFEKQIFPEKYVEKTEAKPKKQNSKSKKIKIAKKQKPVPRNKNILKHKYNLRETKTVKLNEDVEAVTFKVPAGVPIKTTPTSSNKPKDKVDYNSLEKNLHIICGSPLHESTYRNQDVSNNVYKTNNEIFELLQRESETNYYIPKENNNEATENNTNPRKQSLVVNIELKNILDFGAVSKAATKKNYDFLEKVKKLEPEVADCHMKDKLNELKHQVNLKYTQGRDYITNAEKQNKIKTTSSGNNPEDLDALELDKSFVSEVVSMNEEDFIEKVDKIFELIEGKNCSTTNKTYLENCSVDSSKQLSKDVSEEKLMDVDLSSPIQKEFMEEFNATSDVVTETIQQPDLKNISGKSLKETKINNTSFDFGKRTLTFSPVVLDIEKEREFMKQLNLNYVDKNFVSGGLKKISKRSLNTIKRKRSNGKKQECNSKKVEQFSNEFKKVSDGSSNETNPQVTLNENPGFHFVSVKKPTNVFNDLGNGSENKLNNASKSTNVSDVLPESNPHLSGMERMLDKFKNVSEEVLPQIKQVPQMKIADNPGLTDNPGFSFVSGKKPIIKPTNIFKDIFENETKTIKSKKEELFLKEVKSMSETSGEVLPLNELNSNTEFGFVSGKKPTIKSTNIRGENPSSSKSKEEQFIEGFKHIDEELLPPIELHQTRGFCFVSGKKPATKPTNIFNDLLGKNPKTSAFKKENISEGPSKKLLPQDEDNPGFSFVSGKKPVVKPTNIFKDIFDHNSNAAKSKKEEQFLERLKNIPEKQLPPIRTTENSGFSFISGKKPAFKATNLFKDLFEDDSKCSKSLKEKELLEATTSAESNKEILDKPEENNNKNPVIQSYVSPILGMKRPFNSPQIAANSSTPISSNKKLGPSSRKRSLGSAAKSCRQLNLSQNSAKKAKLIFEDFDVQPQDSINNNNNKSNISFASTSKHITSTPKIIKENSASTSLLNTSVSMKKTNETLITSQNKSTTSQNKNITTPTKTNTNTSTLLEKHIPTLYSFQECDDSINQKSQLEKKYELLKLEMTVFQTRLQMLDQQEALIKNASPNHRKQRTGCLLCQKSNNTNKLALKKIKLDKRTTAKALAAGVDKSLLEITPQNALNFQFLVPWWSNDNRAYPAIIRTEDGAVLIPTDQNAIGVREIEQGFLAMPGVDPNLVPENWVRNHYKWIVWKLASYERNFPATFKRTMTVENVIAQLKYRYDREIDLAQRSALKRILEADDSPAKRMVLCVSNIFTSQSRQNELELTDGWYSIKTLVDPVLNNLIKTNKIYIGLKLMIHGAELLNCEGCPPLETPSNVRLQIHFNSTRRAAWHCKLGYQKNPGPLGVCLHTVVNHGGPVGLTTVYIARTYPVCFMEHGDTITWRDKKAERRRANEWEAIQKDIIEQYLEETKNELDAERNERIKKRKKKNRVLLRRDVCKLQDARSIYELWEECNDPESLTELLTEEQCRVLRNYQIEQKSEEQVELATRLRKKLEEKNIKNRTVSSVLKLLVVDVNCLHHHRIVNIWKPNETHLQELIERQCVNFYNLNIKDTRNLSSSIRTCFTLNGDVDKTKFKKFERKVIPIGRLKNKQLFDEFDTVGFVVEVNNEEDNKYMWIVDENKMFLLIRIQSSHQVVSIFDGITPGKVVALKNLVHQKPTQNYAIATGNCYTNLFVQPNQLYLQCSMLEFIKNLSENKEEFFQACQLLLNTYKSENYLKQNELSTSMIYDNLNHIKNKISNTIGFETDVLTVSDEEMSLIDTQYF